MDWVEPGYVALFLLSFSAATLIPIGSEWLLLVMLSQGFSPSACLALATLGNTLGSYTNYGLGYWAHEWIEKRRNPKAKGWRRAEIWYRKYGIWSLLFAWIPIIGDPLTLIAGILKANWLQAATLILISKLSRYLLIFIGYLYLN
ncbi:YqaA family protein [Alteromonas sp. a30]|uniref:YqaA family protein n=1 Tax=Alteromonas sp. a30 TaxID=2730917 RepID=UPI002282183C|nr:YqaA family protein [Alteromonas sp. a30]MCY7297311.1 DedA family protein [Alteromonas sp. a30]